MTGIVTSNGGVEKATVTLTGETLTAEDLVKLSAKGSAIVISKDAWDKVDGGRKVVDSILEQGKVAYGINTGFGLFSNVTVSKSQLVELQENLIRSHSAGTGEPLSPGSTKMLLALRINVLCKGHSGVSRKTLQQARDAFNAGALSVVPCQGTVGASGDLAPLSHLCLGLMGEGMMWDPIDGHKSQRPAKDVLKDLGLSPIVLSAKEGLAMINGTQLITSLGAQAVIRAQNVTNCADVVCAITLEALKGTYHAFHPFIHAVRPHRGQNLVAARLRALIHPGEPSEIFKSHRYKGKVQDAYTLRCAPQVHGIVHDTIQFVKGVIEVEMNSATDNPMVFTGSSDVVVDTPDGPHHVWPPKPSKSLSSPRASFDGGVAEYDDINAANEEIRRLRAAMRKRTSSAPAANVVAPPTASTQQKNHKDTFYDAPGGSGFVISGGNFHGEYPAKVLDYLAIGVSEIASISERRIERLVNPNLSNLPAFLVADGGLNSGFMIAHCTAAALVSENKVLTHPSSVDSLSTSGGKEDHVSMGGYAARKAVRVVEHVEKVVAIELLAACQALEFFRPMKTTPCLEAVHKLVRAVAAPWDRDRIMYPDIEAVAELIRSGAVWDTAKPHLTAFPGTEC